MHSVELLVSYLMDSASYYYVHVIRHGPGARSVFLCRWYLSLSRGNNLQLVIQVHVIRKGDYFTFLLFINSLLFVLLLFLYICIVLNCIFVFCTGRVIGTCVIEPER